MQLAFVSTQVKQLTSQLVHLLVDTSAKVDEGQLLELPQELEFKKLLELHPVQDIEVVWQVRHVELHCRQILRASA